MQPWLLKHLSAILVAVVFSSAAVGAAERSTSRSLDPVLDADPFAAAQLASAPPAGASAALQAFLRGVVAASTLNSDAADRELAAAYDDKRASPEIARRALSIAGAVALRAGNYRRAAELFDRELSQYGKAMDDRSRAAELQIRDVATALRDVPAQTIEGRREAMVALAVHPLGLTTVQTEIDGRPQVAVIDTGANLSVLSASAARNLGVRVLGPRASVRSTTLNAVASRIAVAGRLRLGPTTLRNVVFLVLDDEALSPLGRAQRIDAIIGIPVLIALGRMEFRDRAKAGQPPQRSLTLLPDASQPRPGNLRFAGFDPVVRTSGGLVSLPFVIDSGSDKTSFEKRYAREFPAALKELGRRTIKVGGAGGAEDRQVAIIPKLKIGIGAANVELSNVQIHLNGNGSDTTYGTLGADVLWAKGGYIVDFKALDLSLGVR